MTNNVDSLKNVMRYFSNLQIHTVDRKNIPITTIGDISSYLTNSFVSPGLTSNLISVADTVS